MATKRLLHESSATPVKQGDGLWRAVLITPGQGSSAFYSEEALERSVAALGAGTKNYFMHPDKPGQQRDPRNQWGVIPESVSYEPGVGIVANIKVLKHWREVVESLAEEGQASLSIWAMGETDEDGNLITLTEDTQNAVDLVAYPGRPGSGLTEKLYESAIAASVQKPGVTSAQEKEGTKMEEKLDKLIAAFETFVTESKAAALAAVAAEADAEAVEQAVESALSAYDEKVAAIDAAELLPSQVESLRAAAKKGDDVAPLIEAAKKIVDEAKQFVADEEPEVREYVTEGAKTASDIIPKGW